MATTLYITDDKYNDSGVCTQSYYLEKKKASDTAYTPMDIQYTSPLVIEGLDDDTAYNIRITRRCCNGVNSTSQVVTVITTALSAPEDFESTPDTNSIELTWEEVLSPISADGYVLERGELADYSDTVVIYNGTSNSYNDTGLTTATTYYYRLRATKNGYMASDWVTHNVTTL